MPGTKLITPSGRPASCSRRITKYDESTAVEAGFQTTTLPSMAGADDRLPPMAVKLNGLTAKMKPSSGRYSRRLLTPGLLIGCPATMSWEKRALKRKKSISSQAASISAWCTVLDWQSIVAALMVSRHGPASRSAARRKTAARCSSVHEAHSACAASAASMACSVSRSPPACQVASSAWRSCGMRDVRTSPVKTSLPPMTHGTSTPSLRRLCSRAWIEARSALPGA